MQTLLSANQSACTILVILYMKVIYMNCGVKNYMQVDYRRYHRSYRRNFRIPYTLEIFSGILFATAKVASITVMIYFHINNIPWTNLSWKNWEIIDLSSSSNLHSVKISRAIGLPVFLQSSMQGFPFWKSRSQLKTPYHSSSCLGKRFEIEMTRIFEKRHVYLCLFTQGGLEPSK